MMQFNIQFKAMQQGSAHALIFIELM